MSPAQEHLERRVAAVRAHLRTRALVAAGVWTLSSIGLLLLAAWLVAGPEGWIQGSDVPLVLDGVALALFGGAFHLVRRGTDRWFADAPLSASVERAAGVEHGLVRGSLELARTVPAGVSSSLVEHAAKRTLSRLAGGSSVLSGPLGSRVGRWTRRGSVALTLIAVLLGVVAVVSPARAADVWGGMVTPFRVAADPVLEPIVVTPGSVEVPRGADVEVRVRAPGRRAAELAWQAAGDIVRRETLTLRSGVGTKVFESVTAALEYSVRTPDGARSETYRIAPVDPLFVSDLTVSVSYPPHTGLSPEEYRGTVPPLRLPAGTRLDIEGRASRPLSDAGLVDPTGERVLSLSTRETEFSGSWRPRTGGRFEWTFRDAEGGASELRPDPVELTVLPDSAPTVSIPLPGRDTILPLTLRQPLIVEARDDYGLDRLELVAYRVTMFGDSLEPVVQSADLGGTRAALARPLLDVTAWGLLPGDRVHYFARAIDNAPDARTASSRVYELRMPGSAELRRAAQEELEDVSERLEELSDEARRQAEETRDLERIAGAQQEEATPRPRRRNERPEMAFEEREELRKAIEDQEELTDRVDSLRAELEALEETLREAGEADPQLREDLEELQELLSRMAGDELRDRLDDLSDALERQDEAGARESLRDLASEQEDFQERLERSLERFRRAAVEQDLRATEGEMEEVAIQEAALADAMREGDDPQLRAEQQERLADRTDSIRAGVEELEERLRSLGEDEMADAVKAAGERAADAREGMEEARAQAERGENQEAGETADAAAEEMQDAAKQLDQAQQQQAQQESQATVEALRRAADDALSLARRQSQLGREMRGAGRDRLNDMRADEASLLQGVRNLAESLQEASDGESDGGRDLSAQTGRAMESLQRAIDALQNARGTTPAPAAAAEAAVDDLNQLALMALAGADQMGQQGQGQGQSSEQVSEEMEQLAQQQGDLVNQAGQLTPLQLGAEALREQIEQLAGGQQSIADDLDQLARQERAQEETLGDLDQLADEAEALARQLAGGRLTPDVRRRQERLFHRLLDAGRSLENDDEISDQRESETASAFERGEVVPLGADQMGGLRYPLPDASAMQRLSPAIRQLVIQYFERLNRDRAGASGPSAGPGDGR